MHSFFYIFSIYYVIIKLQVFFKSTKKNPNPNTLNGLSKSLYKPTFSCLAEGGFVSSTNKVILKGGYSNHPQFTVLTLIFIPPIVFFDK